MRARVHGWWWLWSTLLAAVLALTQAQAWPFVSNQNQYFVHVLSHRSTALAGDWLARTADPYPLFSWLGLGLVDAGGRHAVVLASYLTTAVALLAVGVVCRSLAGPGLAWSAWVGMLVAAVSLRLPFLLPAELPRVTAFDGLGGQYLLSGVGYLQPSSSGVLVLMALGLWLGWAREDKSPGRPAVALVMTLCALAAAIHPTYMVVVGVGVLCAVVADVGARRRVPWLGYVAVVVVTSGAALAANPAIRSLGASAGAPSTALDRFAFERIPHHTLLSSWNVPASTVVVATIALGAVLAYPLARRAWLSSWMVACLAVSLGSAVLVEYSRMTSLALAFPWRVTVILVPLSVATATVRVVPLLAVLVRSTKVRSIGVVGAVALVAALAVSGVTSTVREPGRPAVQVVDGSDPHGVGLIPLDQELVRANALVPVYVDWKSPPYASDDLDEYWRRIDEVRALEADPAGMCNPEWDGRVDWVLWPRRERLPDCAAGWPLQSSNEAWMVVLRPTEESRRSG